jgi:hypothetical protein
MVISSDMKPDINDQCLPDRDHSTLADNWFDVEQQDDGMIFIVDKDGMMFG